MRCGVARQGIRVIRRGWIDEGRIALLLLLLLSIHLSTRAEASAPHALHRRDVDCSRICRPGEHSRKKGR